MAINSLLVREVYQTFYELHKISSNSNDIVGGQAQIATSCGLNLSQLQKFLASSNDDRFEVGNKLANWLGKHSCEHCRSSAEWEVAQKRLKLRLSPNSEKHGNPLSQSFSSIRKHLDAYFVGNSKAKDAICSVMLLHLINAEQFEGKGKSSSNLFLIGPTGSGKTAMIKKASEIVNVPFCEVDMANVTPYGFQGRKIQDALKDLLRANNNDVKRIEKAIVFCDNIDSKRAQGKSGVNLAVQQALLTLIKGSKIVVDRDRNFGETLTVETSSMLFICCGAFSGIEALASKRLERVATFSDVKIDDVMSYGICDEFIGRFDCFAKTNPLSAEQLSRIIESNHMSPLLELKEVFEINKLELTWTEAFIKKVVEKALKKNKGVRSLNAVILEAAVPFFQKIGKDENENENDESLLLLDVQHVQDD